MKRNTVKKKAFTFYPEAKFDYHNLGVLTPYDIEKYLVEFIEECYSADLNRILIVTGKGSVVKPMVYRLLKQNKFVKEFKVADSNNGGEGAYEIILGI